MLIIAGLALFVIMAGAGVWAVTRTGYLPRLALWLMKQSLPVILKRMEPEQEEAWRKAMREGDRWDQLRKRPKAPR